MALTNSGFDGTVNEAQFAQMSEIADVDGVADVSSWAVSQGTGRQTSTAAGRAFAKGILSVNTAAILTSLGTPVSGQWYLICRHIDWSTNTVTVVALPHTTTSTTAPTAPPAGLPTMSTTAGTAYDQPLAWVWVNSVNTSLLFFDLRHLLGAAADLAALVLLGDMEGAEKTVQEGGAVFARVGGKWVQQTPATFASTALRDTAYAKASGAFKVAGAQARVTGSTTLLEYSTASTGWKPAGNGPVRLIPTVTGTGVTVDANGRITCAAATSIQIVGFSADFEDFQAKIRAKAGSTSQGLQVQLKSGASAVVATGYDSKVAWDTAAAHTVNADQVNQTFALMAPGNTITKMAIDLDINAPFLAEETLFGSAFRGSTVASGANMLFGFGMGSQRTQASYDTLVLTPVAGTFTGWIELFGIPS